MPLFHRGRKSARRRRRSLGGYTLTEMLVVIAIIGLIAAVVVPQTMGQLGRAQSRTAKLQLQTISAAVELFAADNGRPPTKAEGLKALVDQPAGLDGWQGPYVRSQDQLRDPWNHAYIYEPPSAAGGDFRLGTLGSDQKAGGSGAARDVFLN